MVLTNLSISILLSCVVGAPGCNVVPVPQLFNLFHGVERLWLLGISSGNLLDLVVAELVAGDHGGQAVSVGPGDLK